MMASSENFDPGVHALGLHVNTLPKILGIRDPINHKLLPNHTLKSFNLHTSSVSQMTIMYLRLYKLQRHMARLASPAHGLSGHQARMATADPRLQPPAPDTFSIAH